MTEKYEIILIMPRVAIFLTPFPSLVFLMAITDRKVFFQYALTLTSFFPDYLCHHLDKLSPQGRLSQQGVCHLQELLNFSHLIRLHSTSITHTRGPNPVNTHNSYIAQVLNSEIPAFKHNFLLFSYARSINPYVLFST